METFHLGFESGFPQYRLNTAIRMTTVSARMAMNGNVKFSSLFQLCSQLRHRFRSVLELPCGGESQIRPNIVAMPSVRPKSGQWAHGVPPCVSIRPESVATAFSSQVERMQSSSEEKQIYTPESHLDVLGSLRHTTSKQTARYDGTPRYVSVTSTHPSYEELL